ncbi:MAG: hypothetical protein GDA53_06675 [Rhodobacteraceae bacterium]|nr:hypothetical protein [Paracoccaceae bacterium]
MKRFAFDIGSGSLGWSVFRLEGDGRKPVELVDMGARIFPTGRDPKSRESNALGRRGPRQQRRQGDRRKKRRGALEGVLAAHGLMPPAGDDEGRQDFFSTDPYEARARAARDEAALLYDLGRAIWHISGHRGFKSNRKADRTNKDDTGKIADATRNLREMLVQEGAPTYGAWLAGRHAQGAPVRIRLNNEKGYDFYPNRAVLEEEFDHIWRMQAQYHPNYLTDKARDEIKSVLFFQRPLKPVKPGRCTFFPDEDRLPKWHPLAQEFLILQELNRLRIIADKGECSLDLTQRDLLLNHLMSGKKLTWAGVRKALGIPPDIGINLETGGLKKPAHNDVAARLAVGTKKNPAPLEEWVRRGADKQVLLLSILNDSETPDVAIRRLQDECGLAADIAERVEKVTLPTGHIRLGLRATRAIVRAMRDEVRVYSAAVGYASASGLFGDGVVLNHSDLRPEGDPGVARLPRYYEVPTLRRMIGTGTGVPADPPEIRFGKISNPTVHIGLGQFRRVMNALIDRHGKPDQVVIETTRDMAKSARELNEIETEIRKNTNRNDRWREELEECGLLPPGGRAGDRFLRMRLWEELGKTCADRLCPYSGRPIGLTDLHSDRVEIDHILPFSDTFDDSPANKTVCFRAANREKAGRSPGDAWGDTTLGAIIDRVKDAPGMKRKLWRFLPGALEKWQEDKGFEERQLHATGYLAKVVRAYAEALFPKDGTAHIWMPNGRMTALMRRRWGLHLPDHNAKDRNDHRHHALDAVVVGVIDRATVRMLQTHARRIGAQQLDRVLPEPPEPYDGFRDQVMDRVRNLCVSHRPDHAISGRLHEDTAYSLVRDIPENAAALNIGNLAARKPVTALTAKEITRVRDQRLREELRKVTEAVKGDKNRENALSEWSSRTGAQDHLAQQRDWIAEYYPDYEQRSKRQRARIRAKANKDLGNYGFKNVRTVRVIKPKKSAKPVKSAPYKWMIPDGIAYMDVLENPDGKWFCHATDIWAAQTAPEEPWKEDHPEAKFIMRLYKNDTLQLFELDKTGLPVPGSNRIKKIVQLDRSSSRVYLVGVNDAGEYRKRHEDPDDPFRWDLAKIGKLKARRAHKVRVDELGRVLTIPHGTMPRVPSKKKPS